MKLDIQLFETRLQSKEQELIYNILKRYSKDEYIYIFKHLENKDINTCCMVCKQWRDIIKIYCATLYKQTIYFQSLVQKYAMHLKPDSMWKLRGVMQPTLPIRTMEKIISLLTDEYLEKYLEEKLTKETNIDNNYLIINGLHKYCFRRGELNMFWNNWNEKVTFEFNNGYCFDVNVYRGINNPDLFNANVNALEASLNSSLITHYKIQYVYNHRENQRIIKKMFINCCSR